MIATGTHAHSIAKRRPINVMGATFYKSEWMECGDDPKLSPTVFLVEQPPDTSLVSHFHRQNQFQLFVDGAGSIGRESLGPVTVHYAGAYTGYGPLLSGPAGIKYFTIRAVCEAGFTPISEAKEKMLRGPKRHANSKPLPPLTAAALAALTSTQEQTLIETGDDGMGAHLTRLPPGAAFHPAQVAGSEGRFLFVTAGTLTGALAGALNGAADNGPADLGRWEHLFLLSTDTAPPLSAGPGGAEIVSLFIPHKEAAYL